MSDCRWPMTVFWSHEDGQFIAGQPQLRLAVTGDTPAEAVANLERAIALFEREMSRPSEMMLQ